MKVFQPRRRRLPPRPPASYDQLRNGVFETMNTKPVTRSRQKSSSPGRGRRDGRRRRPTRRHVVNLIAAIRPQTRGGPCQDLTGDTYVATTASTRRMPDMGVDCGIPMKFADGLSPSLVVEVLSPNTGGFDLTVMGSSTEPLVHGVRDSLVMFSMITMRTFRRVRKRKKPSQHQNTSDELKVTGGRVDSPSRSSGSTM